MRATCAWGWDRSLSKFLSLTGGAQITVVTENDRNLIEQFAASELDVIVGPFDQSDTTLMIELPMLDCRGRQQSILGTEVSLDDAVGYQWANNLLIFSVRY